VTFCAAVDIAGNAVIYSDGAWGAPQAIDPGSQLTVACAVAGSCVAVDQGGGAVYYTHGAWTSPHEIDTDSASNDLTAVSCATQQSCVALDGGGEPLAGT
jgi:hypothetical protein